MQRRNSFLVWVLFLFIGVSTLYSQTYNITALVMDDLGETVPFANVILYDTTGSTMLKTEVTDLEGKFGIPNVEKGAYKLVISFIGKEDYRNQVSVENDMDLGILTMNSSGIEIETAIVTAKRSLVEVKADKTVFNVEGTINSVGENGL
jgi:uncharacterized protein (UPF0212 family)